MKRKSWFVNSSPFEYRARVSSLRWCWQVGNADRDPASAWGELQWIPLHGSCWWDSSPRSWGHPGVTRELQGPRKRGGSSLDMGDFSRSQADSALELPVLLTIQLKVNLAAGLVKARMVWSLHPFILSRDLTQRCQWKDICRGNEGRKRERR